MQLLHQTCRSRIDRLYVAGVIGGSGVVARRRSSRFLASEVPRSSAGVYWLTDSCGLHPATVTGASAQSG